MPSAVWSGAISFGLVTIPIRLLPAMEDHSIHFRRVHLEDMGLVRNRKICEIDGEEVTSDEIGKGYEVAKDKIIPISDDELADMPLPTAKAIDVVAFVDRDTIDQIRLGDTYYLEAAGEVAAKPYTLLRKALERSSKAAIAKYALRGRERLGLLSVKENAMVLHQMHWPDEVRDPSELAPAPVELDESEIEGALALMDTMELDGLSGFRDTYTDAVEKLIEAKAEGKTPAAPKAEAKQGGRVVDLMSALEQSVQQAKKSRGESGEDATVHDMPARKKTTAKKAPAKKGEKKTAGRKPRSA
ncbi:putative DNA repair protein YkoV [Streptomyces sp. S4.7]|uniref:non-homologous end joining protein Ku n=1 Tax=Streptomyces sp. S4.7 TaxID=2705439 RepID=UPI0013993866|nr:Ku protein [Streptomyces sp. S4.7]QHY99689.1 putative DNA repair protein YkoV [Streptomyces sp. S4.7]